MKTLIIEKVIIYAVIAIILLASVQMISDYMTYSHATDCINSGNYFSAAQALEKLDEYRDAEVLKKYCQIMNGYNSEDFVSIYHCYRGLSDLEGKLTNEKLAEEFTRTTTEVETLYKHYNIALSAK